MNTCTSVETWINSLDLSTETAHHFELETYEANSKKKLQPATEVIPVKRKPESLAGRTMYLPDRKVQGLSDQYKYYEHPVVVLSPSVYHRVFLRTTRSKYWG